MAACPICGNPKPGKRFCTRCGTKVSKTPVPTVPAAADATQRRPSTTERLPQASGVKTRLDLSARLAEASAKAGSNRQIVLALLGALLFFAAGILVALWWYSQADTGQGASTSNSANGAARSNQPTQPAIQTPDRDRQPTVSSPPPSSRNTSLPASSYLWEVMPGETSGTADAVNALSASDAQVAVIKPGAQLALTYREGQFFGDGDGDDIRVFGPPQERVSYMIFVRNDPATAWKRVDVNRRGFSQGFAGHDIGHHRVRQARQILIRNDGNADLSIDAIAAVYKELVSPGNRPQSRH